MSIERSTYPFSAIVGQEQMKLALILNAVNPGIGGVLIRGEKGCAKSTTVRALASLLPEMEYIEGCPFFCPANDPNLVCKDCREKVMAGLEISISRRMVPVVDLPLSVTEDMVLGSIDFEFAMQKGERRFRPGILACANRGIVYIDEVNLLDDHIVDVILDVAESGVNVVEREGISFRHPARFILVGTMNPEEGELRPQFLDRFGLYVHIEGEKKPANRLELIKRREAFDVNPERFIENYQEKDYQIATQILAGRKRLSNVTMPSHLRAYISEICLTNNVAGHRADIVIERTAIALAAFGGRLEVTPDDIRHAPLLALPHRQRDAELPPPPPLKKNDKQEEGDSSGSSHDAKNRKEKHDDVENPRENGFSRGERVAEISNFSEAIRSQKENENTFEQFFEIGQTFRVKPISIDKDRILRRGSGKRSRTRTAQKQGRYVKSTLERKSYDLALDATMRAAAPYQKVRRNIKGLALNIQKEDIREKVRERRIGNFIVFVVDASGSMGAQNRMKTAKAALMSLLLDAYQKRDRICLIAFRKEQAEVLLPPTNSIELAGKLLKELPVGGRTPLSDALVKTGHVFRAHFVKEPTGRPLAILITDGKANVAVGNAKPHIEAIDFAHKLSLEKRVKYIVVDTEKNAIVNFGLAAQLADALRAEYFRIEDLEAGELVNIIRKENLWRTKSFTPLLLS